MEKKYFVSGGIFTNFDFNAIEGPNYEFYGPFENYQDAYDKWKERVWLNVDNALHKLHIGFKETN